MYARHNSLNKYPYVYGTDKYHLLRRIFSRPSLSFFLLTILIYFSLFASGCASSAPQTKKSSSTPHSTASSIARTATPVVTSTVPSNPVASQDQGQQKLTALLNQINQAQTLHGIYHITFDAQNFSGVIESEQWNSGTDKSRQLIRSSTIAQYIQGETTVINGSHIWQYDPSHHVVYTGTLSDSAANNSSSLISGLTTGQNFSFLPLLKLVLGRGTGTLQATPLTIDGHTVDDIHVVSNVSSSDTSANGSSSDTPGGAPGISSALNYNGEVYLDKSSQLPVQLNLSLGGIGRIILNLPTFEINPELDNNLFTFQTPADAKEQPWQASNANNLGGTTQLTFVQAQQEAGYHLLSVPADQSAYELEEVSALGIPGQSVYELRYTKGNLTFLVIEGKPLANLPAPADSQHLHVREHDATILQQGDWQALTWTEQSKGITIYGNVSRDDLLALAQILR